MYSNKYAIKGYGSLFKQFSVYTCDEGTIAYDLNDFLACG